MAGRAVLIVLLLLSAANAQPAPSSPTSPPPVTPAAAAPGASPERFGVGVGVGVGVGGDKGSFLYGAFNFEAGVAVLHTPVRLRVRAFANAGGSYNGPGTGTFARAGIGVEPRWCRKNNRLCGFAGVDFGYHAFWDDEYGSEPGAISRGPFAGPRLGFEAGSFRMALEYYRQLTNPQAEADPIIGIALGLAIQR